ncbi:endonuclease/exonuclease/phosphatase family protein [Micromonospora aurantiaca (nom. illeg.)]|uniref:endonuclease/exonuclease/phosphatase family protein n=1 Tax=Micromonospora aurantiaca (nom. illeg.) TaxID=47850 RepID=UPI0033D30013
MQQTRRFATYNTKDLFANDDPDSVRRYGWVAEVIAELDADVVAVQEITATTQPAAEALLAHLAEMTGMTATISPATGPGGAVYAAGAGGHRLAVGLLWRKDPAIVVQPDTVRVYGASSFFHSLIKLAMTIDGVPITVASWHAAPVGKHRRADEAERVVSAVAFTGRPALVGCDGNTIGSATIVDPVSGERALYDADPYAAQPWQPGFVHTCTWQTDDDGVIVSHAADRTPTQTLSAGGLRDVAPTLGVPWAPTAGHHPTDALGMPRRLDYTLATGDVQLVQYQVVDTALTRKASDHLPTVTTWATRP